MSKTEISDQKKTKKKRRKRLILFRRGSLKVIQRKTNDTDKLQVQNYFVLEHLCSITEMVFCFKLSDNCIFNEITVSPPSSIPPPDDKPFGNSAKTQSSAPCSVGMPAASVARFVLFAFLLGFLLQSNTCFTRKLNLAGLSS